MDQARPQNGRIWLWIAASFVVVWVIYLKFFAPRPPTMLENSALPQPAEYGWQLLDLDGKPVSFSRFKGKTVFLNIWATWCPPCVGEMPSIAALAQNPRLRDRGIEFVCVSVDESSEPVRTFLERKDWSMTFLRADSSVPPVFNTEGIPATFLIDRTGRVAASRVGSADWNEPDVVAFIDKLVSAAAPTTASQPQKSVE